MNISKKRVEEFQKKILSWWQSNKRDLPWRHTHDPYEILVSEVMLQQTQVARVIPKYREFLLEFPSVFILAQRPLSRVLQVWKGMGYNRRAQYLQKAAKLIVEQYNGEFPSKEKELLALPGLGLYTARAIQVFAWKRDVAMVDTNIRQIIVHYFFDGQSQPPKIIQETADIVVPVGKSWQWHQALMDYGALAMPTIKKQSGRMNPLPKKNVVAFKDSPRFIRGKIIDILRISAQKEHMLIKQLADTYGRTQENITIQLNKLIREQMVERLSDGVVQLP